jgi:hypothetical protein
MPQTCKSTNYEVRSKVGELIYFVLYFVLRTSYFVFVLWHCFLIGSGMKTIFLLLILCVVVAFAPQQYSGSIRGKVLPHNAALHVWAVSDGDTGRGVLQNGEFEIRSLKPGRYRLIIDARLPYKVTTKPDVIVNDSSNTDVGEIRLDQR